MKASSLKLEKTHDFIPSGEDAKLLAVFVHGIASDSSTFNKTLEYLESDPSLEDVRFVTFDLLGSGKSYSSDDLNYNYEEQILALENSINELPNNIPLVLIGHSMGSLIAAKYAKEIKREIKRLVLVSPPIYTVKDLENPAMSAAIKVFEKAVSVKIPNILKEKSFTKSMENIVLNKDNYKDISGLSIPTTIIFGELDQFIASYNFPSLAKNEPCCFTIIKTIGKHGMSHDKYYKIKDILEEELNEDL